MLAAATIDGIVESTVPGLARLANLSIPEVEGAVEKLLGPDSYSRTAERDGRRIEQIDGGYRLINYDKYRELMSQDDLRTKAALRQQRYRDRNKASRGVTRDKTLLPSRQAEAEAEAEEKNKPSSSENTEPIPVRYDADVDGTGLFEKACSAYPKPERDYATQTLYFETIGKVRSARQCSDTEAVDWLHSRIVLYSQRTNPAYAVGLEKFLRKEIYNQPETAWGSAESADVPIRKVTSVPLSQRMAQEATHGN
jgi:hypothetical protein